MLDNFSRYALEPDPGFRCGVVTARKGPQNAGFWTVSAKINTVKNAACFVNMPIWWHTSGTARIGGAN